MAKINGSNALSMRKLGFLIAEHRWSAAGGFALAFLATTLWATIQTSDRSVFATVQMIRNGNPTSIASSSRIDNEITRRIEIGSRGTARKITIDGVTDQKRLAFVVDDKTVATAALERIAAVNVADAGHALSTSLISGSERSVPGRSSLKDRARETLAPAGTPASTIPALDERLERLSARLAEAQADLTRRSPRTRPQDNPAPNFPYPTGKALLLKAQENLLSAQGQTEAHRDVDASEAASLHLRLAAIKALIQTVEAKQARIDQDISSDRKHIHILRKQIAEFRRTRQSQILAASAENIKLATEGRMVNSGQGSRIENLPSITEAPISFVILSSSISHHPRIAWTPAIALIGSCISLLTSIGFALISELTMKGFRSQHHAETFLGRNVSAVVPEIDPRLVGQSVTKRRDWPIDYLLVDRNTPFSLAFRKMVAGLDIRSGARKGRTLAISSALPSEGKTTVSICLARSAALVGLRVILIDCDGRRRMLSKALPALSKPGLVQVLSDDVPLGDALDKDEPSGALILRHSSDDRIEDLSSPERLQSLLSILVQDHDLVILDTAPVLALAEARVTAAICDQALLVIRWRITPRRATRLALRNLVQARANVSSAVLTRVRCA